MLAAQLEKTIQNLWYSGPKRGFNVATYVERHKDVYQSMLALAKKTDYIAYDPGTRVRHFLNGITDPSFAQAKLSLKAKREQYSGDFDATVEYLMNQVTHQQVNQQLHVASVDSGAPICLKQKLGLRKGRVCDPIQEMVDSGTGGHNQSSLQE